MTRWPKSLARRVETLRDEKTCRMRRTLTRVRFFAMRGGLRGWDPYPLRRKP
jgi:hypothetical protein